MPIFTITKRDEAARQRGSRALRRSPPSTLESGLWFIGLWCAGVASVGAAATLMRVLMHACLHTAARY